MMKTTAFDARIWVTYQMLAYVFFRIRFSGAFKQLNGQSVSAWMRLQASSDS